MNRQDQIVKDFLDFTRSNYPRLYLDLNSGVVSAPMVQFSSKLPARPGFPGARTPGMQGQSIWFEQEFSQAWHQFEARRQLSPTPVRDQDFDDSSPIPTSMSMRPGIAPSTFIRPNSVSINTQMETEVMRALIPNRQFAISPDPRERGVREPDAQGQAGSMSAQMMGPYPTGASQPTGIAQPVPRARAIPIQVGRRDIDLGRVNPWENNSPFADPGGILMLGGRYRGRPIRDIPEYELARNYANHPSKEIQLAVRNYLKGKHIISPDGRYLGIYEDLMADRGNLSGPDLDRDRNDYKQGTKYSGRSKWDTEDRGFAGTHDSGERSYLALVGFGGWDPSDKMVRQTLDRKDRSEADARHDLQRFLERTSPTGATWGGNRAIDYSSRRKYERRTGQYDPEAWASYEDADLNRRIFGRANAVQFDPMTRKYVPRFKDTGYYDPRTKEYVPGERFEDRPIASEFRVRYKSAAAKIFGKSVLDQILDPHATPKAVPIWVKNEGKWQAKMENDGKSQMQRLVHPYSNLKRLLYQVQTDLYEQSGEFGNLIRWSEEVRGAERAFVELRDPGRQPFNVRDAHRESLKEFKFTDAEIDESLRTQTPLIRSPIPESTRKLLDQMRVQRQHKREDDDYLYERNLQRFPRPEMVTSGRILDEALEGRAPAKFSRFEASVAGMSPSNIPNVNDQTLDDKRELLQQLHSGTGDIGVRQAKDIVNDPASDLAALPRLSARTLMGVNLSLQAIPLILNRELLELTASQMMDRYGNSPTALSMINPVLEQQRALIQTLANGGKST